jgi:hypothetical protein
VGDGGGEVGGYGIADKRKRGEGENLLGDRLQDNGSARAETRGLSEQQAGSEGAGRLSNATLPPVRTYPAGLNLFLANPT